MRRGQPAGGAGGRGGRAGGDAQRDGAVLAQGPGQGGGRGGAAAREAVARVPRAAGLAGLRPHGAGPRRGPPPHQRQAGQQEEHTVRAPGAAGTIR